MKGEELPFNTNILGADFIPVRPGDQLPDLPAYWVILQGKSLVVLDDGRQVSLPQGKPPVEFTNGQEPLCIGLWEGCPLLTLAIDTDMCISAPLKTVSFHSQEILLDDRLSTLAGLAGQILHWERQSRFCSYCAGKMERIDGTWGKRCMSCRAEHFPHIHPCVIVLIRRGEEMLLIRRAEWSTGRYSIIAGFLDFGESLEECVRREAREEAGVEVTNIRYVGSQNWPFPSQQMIGFLADYAGGDLKPDGIEVVEARWFTADTLPLYPGNVRSIARWILDTYGRINKRN
jgi:NAD+ diphosphatase